MGIIPDADVGIVILVNADVIGLSFSRDVQYHLIELALGLDPFIDEIVQAKYARIVGPGQFVRSTSAG